MPTPKEKKQEERTSNVHIESESDGSSWLSNLRRDVPEDLIKSKPVNWGKGYVEYVEWNAVADILDRVLGERWNFHIIDMKFNTSTAICHGRLVVVDGDGRVVERDGIGTGTVIQGKQDGWELATKKAASDALKRAATLFGVARSLYEDEAGIVHHQDDEFSPSPRQPRPATGRPAAAATAPRGQSRPHSGGGGSQSATTKQLNMIRAVSAKLGLDADEECLEVIGVYAGDLTLAQASEFITHLKELEAGGV